MEQKIAAVRNAGDRPPVAPGAEVTVQDVIAAALRMYKGDKNKVLRWLIGERRAGYTPPRDKRATEDGRRELYETLMRLEIGVYG
jgi:hypothetical protein